MTPASRTTHTEMSRAWWSLLLFIPALVAAFVVGEGIPAWLGYDLPSVATTPLWVITLAFCAATIVMALPLLVVSRLCRHEQESAGRTPLLVAWIVVAGFVGLNLFGLVTQLLFG